MNYCFNNSLLDILILFFSDYLKLERHKILLFVVLLCKVVYKSFYDGLFTIDYDFYTLLIILV